MQKRRRSLARQQPREGVLATINRAIEVARRQGARMLELRAAARKAVYLPEHAREEGAALGELQAAMQLDPDGFDQELLARAAMS